LPAELSLHLLAAVGIFLGRVDRLNSWDILARPVGVVVAVVHLVQSRPLVTMVVLVVIIDITKSTVVSMGRVMLASLRWARRRVNSQRSGVGVSSRLLSGRTRLAGSLTSTWLQVRPRF
jgi:hypothetical protein